VTTDRCCEIVDSIDCRAAPDHGEPASEIVTCWGCGRDVCRACSSVIMYRSLVARGARQHRRTRFCFDCQDERKIGRSANSYGRTAKEIAESRIVYLPSVRR
jgi:hypothetical protein